MIDFSHVSELGDRETQQDCEGCWVSEHSALAVVADGAGSYHNSEEASATVVAYLQQSWKQALCYGMEPAAAGQLISDAVLKAHRHILDAVGGDAGRCGKSALVALYTHKGAYTVVHVGDCRAYLGRGKRWKQLTKDDSMLQRLLDSGKITPEEAKDSPEQSVLLQAVGASVAPKPHISSGTFRSTDGFLLCCDGFWNQLPEDKWPLFASCAPQNRQHFLKTLVGSAVENAAGDSDNVSVIWQHPVVYRTPAQALTRATVLWTAITALITAIAALSYLLYPQITQKLTTTEGATTEGATTEGATTEGATTEGATTEGTTTEGATTEGATTEGATTEGATTEGATTEGATTEGATTEGATTEGTTTEGATTEGATTEGATTEGATTEGATTEGATTEGATTEGATTEGATTEGATTEGATTEGATTEGAKTKGTQVGRKGPEGKKQNGSGNESSLFGPSTPIGPATPGIDVGTGQR